MGLNSIPFRSSHKHLDRQSGQCDPDAVRNPNRHATASPVENRFATRTWNRLDNPASVRHQVNFPHAILYYVSDFIHDYNNTA